MASLTTLAQSITRKLELTLPVSFVNKGHCEVFVTLSQLINCFPSVVAIMTSPWAWGNTAGSLQVTLSRSSVGVSIVEMMNQNVLATAECV